MDAVMYGNSIDTIVAAQNAYLTAAP